LQRSASPESGIFLSMLSHASSRTRRQRADGLPGVHDVAEPALTPERILEAAEEVLRRFGPEKATVVDVARALGVTHGSVYRHFASKAALRDAVVRRWLETMMPPLEAVVAEEGPAAG